ncbi:hypothetical protein J6590_072093 [Homalodisca vitripennis]|nr:hypothetical protein J6590_072093 [Homalodisca vitripennis]
MGTQWQVGEVWVNKFPPIPAATCRNEGLITEEGARRNSREQRHQVQSEGREELTKGLKGKGWARGLPLLEEGRVRSCPCIYEQRGSKQTDNPKALTYARRRLLTGAGTQSQESSHRFPERKLQVRTFSLAGWDLLWTQWGPSIGPVLVMAGSID